MSDTYDINGVTVTPLGGGFYELKHASITAEGGIEKVRGKEAADARAAEIAKAAQPADGHMEPQTADLNALQAKADSADQAQADADAALQAEKDRSAALEARMNAMEETNNKLLAAFEKASDVVTTVQATEGEVEGRVPGGIPNSFSGELDPAAKKALKKAGLGYSKIILEENSDIPPTGLFVGHNGRGYQIQTGEPVDVPDFVLGVLDDAKMSAPVVDNKTMKVLGYRERMKYPYRRVD